MSRLVDLRYLEATSDGNAESASGSPGKRTLTGRLQRRAAAPSAPSAPGGAAPPPSDDEVGGGPDGTQSFVDSLLADP